MKKLLLICFCLMLTLLSAPNGHGQSGGTINTVAGNGVAAFSGDNGAATSASLRTPVSVAVDGAGNFFIADRDNHRIRKVTSAGIISTVAGNGTAGFSGDNGPATSATLNGPVSVAVDGANNLFIVDLNNSRIRKVTSTGIISTIAGNGVAGFGGDNGPGTSAQLNYPYSVAVDGAGNVFIADFSNHRVRKVTATGIISTFAGNGVAGFSGDNGPAASANLRNPVGVAVDVAGNLFIADSNNNRVRKVTTTGIISTVAGNGVAGFSGDNGAAISASMSAPCAVAADRTGGLFIASATNQRIRGVTSTGTISTVAGTGTAGFSGDNGAAISAQLSSPCGMAVDATGNLFITDSNNNRVRKVTFGAVQVQVSIAPTSASVLVERTQQFTPTVTGTGNTAVTWSVNGITGGNSTVGTISTAGLYTAPSAVPNPATVTVRATSVADPTKSGTASVTVMGLTLSQVTVAPTSVTLASGGTQSFTATVTGTTNQAVTWSVNGTTGGNSTIGTISTAGLYTAPSVIPSPATVTVRATSVADTSKSGTASVTVMNTTTIQVTVAPTSASVATSGTQQFTPTVTGTSNQAVTWSVNSIVGGNSTIGTISTTGLYKAPAVIPSPATVTVRATSVADATKSGTASVTVTNIVQVTVAPTSASVAAGGTLQVTPTVTGASNLAVTWSVNNIVGGNTTIGTISTSGVYKAPENAPTPATVTVKATSVADPTKSATAAVTVTPPVIQVTVGPTPVSVTTTQQFTCKVTGTANTAVTWSVNGIVGGNSTIGTISTTGLYTAPAAVPNPATVTVRCTSVVDPTKAGLAVVTVITQANVSITSADATGSEPGEPAAFTVRRTGDNSSDLKVNLTYGGTATFGVDYTAPSFVTIRAGSASADGIVMPIEDSNPEPNETVIVSVPVICIAGASSQCAVTLTILDDDTTVSISVTDPDASEEGPDSGSFRLVRNGDTSADLTVNLSYSGAASYSVDYTAQNSLVIPRGSSTVNGTVTPIDDALNEPIEEEAIVTVASGAGYKPRTPTSVTIKIADNDGDTTVSITATDPTASEPGTDTGAFRVTRTGKTTTSLTVNYVTAGTAINGTDYSGFAPTGSITISQGNSSTTMTVRPLDDNLSEGPETVEVRLIAGAGYAVRVPSATLEIGDKVQPLAVSRVSCNPNPAPASAKVNCQVSLSVPAPSAGTVVQLRSDRILEMPSELSVAAGSATADFAIEVGSVPTDTSVTLTASLNGSTVPGVLEVLSTRPYRIPGLGGQSLTTTESGAVISIAHTRVQPSDGGAPAGFAIFGYQQNNVLVSEAAVPITPLLTGGRIYAEVGGPLNTGIAIANPGNGAATVSFHLTDTNGTSLGERSLTILPQAQVAKFLDEEPFLAPSNFQGTLTFTSNAPLGVIALRGYTNERGDFLISTAPVAELAPATLPGLVFPHYADGGGWTSQLLLINPTDRALSGTVRFYNQGSGAQAATPISLIVDGVSSTSFQYTIAPQSSRKLQTSGTGSLKVGSVRVNPSNGSSAPVGVEVFSFTAGGIRVSEASVVAAAPGTRFRLYAEPTTGVAITNASDAPTSVTFSLFNLDGAPVGGPETRTLPPAGQMAAFLNEVFQTIDRQFQGIMRITSTESVSVVGLRGRPNERGDFLVTTTPPIDEALTRSNSEQSFPHLVFGGGYTTQLVLHTTGADAQSGALRFVYQTGRGFEPKLENTVIDAVDTTQPEVRIISPGENDTLQGVVGLAVDASDDTGITSIDIEIDDTPVTTTPISSAQPRSSRTLQWDTRTSASGQHKITVTARDAAGHKTPASLGVTVDQPPTVKVVFPQNDILVSGNVDISVQANDDLALASLKIEIDNVAVSSQSTFRWDTTKYPPGRHNIKATVTDSAGRSRSDAVDVIATAPPSLKVVSPANGASVSNESIAIQVDASDRSRIPEPPHILIDGTEVGRGYSYTWDGASAQAGLHSITASANDSTGVPISDTINVTVDPPPTVAIEFPSNGQIIYQGGIVQIRASSNAPLVAIEIAGSEGILWQASDSTYSWKVTEPLGTYTITARALNRTSSVPAVRSIQVEVVGCIPGVNVVCPH